MAFCGIRNVQKKRLFYVFDEHTDYVRECQKMGMTPIIVTDSFAKDFEYDGTKYKALSCNECYSGWEITVMALPEMSYLDLVTLMMNSQFYDEIVGSIGIALKRYPHEFFTFLNNESLANRKIRKIKKIIKSEISERNPNVKELIKIIDLY